MAVDIGLVGPFISLETSTRRIEDSHRRALQKRSPPVLASMPTHSLRTLPCLMLSLSLLLFAACASAAVGAEETHDERGPGANKVDEVGSCEESCDEQAPTGCWCDEACESYDDCCSDKSEVCDCEPSSCDGLCGEANDGCGSTQDCGPCACEPSNCDGLCGEASDGCGGTQDCGPCTCEPSSCDGLCGEANDGCGSTQDCGVCDAFLPGGVFTATGDAQAGPLSGLCLVDASLVRQGAEVTVTLHHVQAINSQGSGRIAGFDEQDMIDALADTTIVLGAGGQASGSVAGWLYDVVVSETEIEIDLDTSPYAGDAVACATSFAWPPMEQTVTSWEGYAIDSHVVTQPLFYVTPVLPAGQYDIDLGPGSSANEPEMRVRAGYAYPSSPFFGWAVPDCKRIGSGTCSVVLDQPSEITIALNPRTYSWATYDLNVVGF